MSAARDPAAASGECIISDRAIVNAVGVEFDRTLPFWRCFVDFRLAKDTMKVRPVTMSRDTRLVCRAPCEAFAGVDVVWAKTRVTLRAPLSRNGRKRFRFDDPQVRSSRFWREMAYRDETYTIGTMHFVHRDAHSRLSASRDKSFHIQSVVLYDDPACLQCVAGTMVCFAFMLYGGLRVVRERETKGYTYNPMKGDTDAARLRTSFLPPESSKVLILGMGGNSMALCLRRVLGADAEIHVVEVEPAVVQVCRLAETLPLTADEDNSLHVHLEEAGAFLRSSAPGTASTSDCGFDMIFMDLFEPINAKMDKSESLLHLCEQRLRPGGLLVVNDHQLPSAESLQPFCDMVGAENVQAVNLHGWNESVVVCVKPGDPQTDRRAVQCHTKIAQMVFEIYEEVLPGWLPHFSWLKSNSRVPLFTGCRVWKS